MNVLKNIGSYRDDGLLVSNSSPTNMERLKQEISAIYQSQGFKVTIEANKKQINFLDVTFNLESQSFKHYIKPGDSPLYVNSASNHPPNVIQKIVHNFFKQCCTFIPT